MLDQTEAEAGVAAAMLDGKTYDLVVVGAGIAGLNALNSAAEYLPKGARVLLLDQKTKPATTTTTLSLLNPSGPSVVHHFLGYMTCIRA
jgi:phytoene dehydrogenase-like protein